VVAGVAPALAASADGLIALLNQLLPAPLGSVVAVIPANVEASLRSPTTLRSAVR
jgi:hypothetical protein